MSPFLLDKKGAYPVISPLMGYCIMRMEKIKSRSSLVRAAQHNTRERSPLNADQDKASQNFATGTVDDAMTKYSQMLPGKVRKNAVHAVELLMTASPDYAGDWKAYLRECGKWAENLFGKSNVLSVTQHFDETTPHAHILVMPLKDGKLNANFFIGGSRDRMSQLQDDFYENVGKRFELDRGRSRAETKARHARPALYKKFAELDRREKNLEHEKDLAERAMEIRAKELEEKNQKLQEFAKEYKKLHGFHPEDVKAMRTRLEQWDKATPAALRVIARDVEQSGAVTVGEYRMAREAQREKQQSRSSSFSR